VVKYLLQKFIYSRKIHGDIVVIDSVLPSQNPIGPRNSDLITFSKKLPGFKYYTMYPMKPGPKAWFSHAYGMTKEQFDQNMPIYLSIHPELIGKLELLHSKKKYKFKLAYTYFLSETYTLLPFLEKHKIPFVFLLNPGGAFGIDNDSSDGMLRTICASPYFKKVIVNQRLFKEYLLRKSICDESSVVYDFSGSAQFTKDDVRPKRYYKKSKKNFDICFVAAKYSEKGVDKGYDLFIAAAKKLSKVNPNMRFHVVGGFDENEISVNSISDRIKFYGFLPASTLPEFYSGMDIFLSPNRPFKLYEGNSDGFPLSAGAMYCGVAGFNADELHMNVEFDADEVVIVKTQVKDIVNKVQHYFDNLDELYDLSKKGQKKAQLLYDIDRHIEGRVRLFNEIIREET